MYNLLVDVFLITHLIPSFVFVDILRMSADTKSMTKWTLSVIIWRWASFEILENQMPNYQKWLVPPWQPTLLIVSLPGDKSPCLLWLDDVGPKSRIPPPNLSNNSMTAVIGQSRHVTSWTTLRLVGGGIHDLYPLFCLLSKHETLNQWWLKVGPASQTVGQP